MKCTECNKEVKPVVAIDIDGTMGQYHIHFLEFASGYLNVPVRQHYVGNQPFKEWFCTNYRCTVDDWHDIKLAYRQGGMKRTMPVYQGARFLCENVKAMGAELWVTTTRPYIRHDNIDPDTREWLQRHKIPYDFLLYDGDKYKKLSELVGQARVAAVLDDLIDEIIDANKLFGPNIPILRMNAFNRATTWQVKSTSLEMAEKIIRDRIKLWRSVQDGTKTVLRQDDKRHPTGVTDEVQEEVK